MPSETTTLPTSIFNLVIGEEGGLSLTASDPGNCTPDGHLYGTKWGISSRTYSSLLAQLTAADRAGMPATVAELTQEQARVIYQTCCWAKRGCDLLPLPLALLVFDASVNGGYPGVWLQTVLGVTRDGVIGPATAAAARAYAPGLARLCAEFQAHRLAYDTSLALWPIYGAHNDQPEGWAHRICWLAVVCMSLSEADGPSV